MDKLVIQGGRPLLGDIKTSGAKNAALPILAATLLSSETHYFENLPALTDVKTMEKLLCQLGAKINQEGTLHAVQVKQIDLCEAPYDLVKTMRASILVLGPLLAKYGEARVSLPGGCAIGARPVNLHLDALKAMGAEIGIAHGMIYAKARRLKGARIVFDVPTVTGTENVMMAATIADGKTEIHNAACEPEVVDLACFLNHCGARITGFGSPQMTIEGTPSLPNGGTYCVMPDRIEAGTLMLAAAVTGGEVMIRQYRGGHLASLIETLREMGVKVQEEKGGVRVRGGPVRPVNVTTAPYPGFPTDIQAQIMTLMSLSGGISTVTETIFENRFNHVAELNRMGADIHLEGNQAIIRGVLALSGAKVMASDLRASASLVLAGLVAQGTTEISRIYHLDRGYERLEEKLVALGASIRRVSSPL